jgi:hypothetical protein
MKPFKQDLTTAPALSLATQYHLSLNLEVLRGCQFSCTGCHVNKLASGEAITVDESSNLLAWLESVTTQGNYLPTLVFIGPTDFLSSPNTAQVLNDPNAVAVISRFKRLSLQTTYLDLSKMDEIAQVLHRHYSHMELEINFILEPEHLLNKKYIAKIKAQREQACALLDWKQPLLSFCLINVYEYDRIRKKDIQGLLNDYKQLHDLVHTTFGTTIDFNFSLSRNNWMSSKDIEEAIVRVSSIFDQGINHEFNQTIRFSFGKLTDSLVEKHYNWRGGQWYLSPLLYERIASFVPELKIPFVHYTVAETEAFEESLLVEQYQNSHTKTQCASCRYLGSCIDRNILKVMDIYDIKDCIIARAALDSINVITL